MYFYKSCINLNFICLINWWNPIRRKLTKYHKRESFLGLSDCFVMTLRIRPGQNVITKFQSLYNYTSTRMSKCLPVCVYQLTADLQSIFGRVPYKHPPKRNQKLLYLIFFNNKLKRGWVTSTPPPLPPLHLMCPQKP